MKKIMVGIVVFVTALGLGWYINHKNNTDDLLRVETLSYDISNELADVEGVFKEYPILVLYFNEIKDLQLDIEDIKTGIEAIKIDLDLKKADLETLGVTLIDSDRLRVKHLLTLIHFNQSMLEETIGEVYEKLIYMRDHSNQLSKNDIKTSLIDVYHTINARKQMFENIYIAFTDIQDILLMY